MPSDRFGDGVNRDPENDPFACSLCGCYLGERDRVAGENCCGDCRRESNAPGDGESRDGAGHVRPVPPGVPSRPDGDADE